MAAVAPERAKTDFHYPHVEITVERQDSSHTGGTTDRPMLAVIDGVSWPLMAFSYEWDASDHRTAVLTLKVRGSLTIHEEAKE